MTQQQLLQQARNVLTGKDKGSELLSIASRSSLKTAAVAMGRSRAAASKAGTMRLALWVSKGTSAI